MYVKKRLWVCLDFHFYSLFKDTFIIIIIVGRGSIKPFLSIFIIRLPVMVIHVEVTVPFTLLDFMEAVVLFILGEEEGGAVREREWWWNEGQRHVCEWEESRTRKEEEEEKEEN